VLNDAAIWKSLTATHRLTLIAGPCVIETEALCFRVAGELERTCRKLDINYVFKASFDKANRTSIRSFRGPGLEAGLKILAKVRGEFGVPVLTDVHTEAQAAIAGEVVDVLQIPAFLCRQTDLIEAAVVTGQVVNLKKGQFLSPQEMENAVEKVRSQGNEKILLTERGTFFGYNNLVFDVRSIPTMKRWGFPVVIDASHIVQRPGGRGTASGGEAEFIPLLVRTGVAAGADGLFLEVHERPDKALSDPYNSLKLNKLEEVLRSALRISKALAERAPAAR